MHEATSRFGLTVGDIRNMSFGAKMKVLIMDRNVGDYASGLQKDAFDPSEIGFSYATYIHGENLTGMLKFEDVGVIHAPFVWELNLAAFGDQSCYWGPFDGGCTTKLEEKDIPNDVLVGWRGPAIDMKHMHELPSCIRLYDTWWDDYGIHKYFDWTHRI